LGAFGRPGSAAFGGASIFLASFDGGLASGWPALIGRFPAMPERYTRRTGWLVS
jgi:hypothetical protein